MAEHSILTSRFTFTHFIQLMLVWRENCFDIFPRMQLKISLYFCLLMSILLVFHVRYSIFVGVNVVFCIIFFLPIFIPQHNNQRTFSTETPQLISVSLSAPEPSLASSSLHFLSSKFSFFSQIFAVVAAAAAIALPFLLQFRIVSIFRVFI